MSFIIFTKNGKMVTFKNYEHATFTIGGEYGFYAHDEEGNLVRLTMHEEDVHEKNEAKQIAQDIVE